MLDICPPCPQTIAVVGLRSFAVLFRSKTCSGSKTCRVRGAKLHAASKRMLVTGWSAEACGEQAQQKGIADSRVASIHHRRRFRCGQGPVLSIVSCCPPPKELSSAC